MNIVIFLIIGAVAGWLAGMVMKTGNDDLIKNIVLGVVGSFVGGFLFSLLGISSGGGLIGSILTATVGASLLIFVVGKLSK